VARREVGATPPAGELAVPADDVALEADVRAAGRPDHALLALDNAPEFGRVEDLAGEGGIRRDCLDAVDDRRERQLLVFEVFEQRNAEFDPVVHARTWARDHKAFAGGPASEG